MTIRVHFDGKNLVPDEPLKLPIDTPLLAEVRPANQKKRTPTLAKALGLLKTGTPAPTDTQIRQILEDELLRKNGG